MDAMEELIWLSNSMLQAAALLADEEIDEPSRRTSAFLNVVALGNAGAGKSAVLDSLIGHPVLPTVESGGTPVPISIDLQRDSSLSRNLLVLQVGNKSQYVSASILQVLFDNSLQDRLCKVPVFIAQESDGNVIYMKLCSCTGGNGGRGGDVILECSSDVWDFGNIQHH